MLAQGRKLRKKSGQSMSNKITYSKLSAVAATANF